MRYFASALALSAGLAALPAGAEVKLSDDVIRIGVINDQTGGYSDYQGPGSVAAARMAIADFGGTLNGKKIELLVGDHQNKTDIGSGIARRWMDQDGVDMMIDFGNSSISLAVQELTRDKTVTIHVSTASDALYGEKCSRTGFMWNYDSYAIGQAIGRSARETGAETWYMIVADYGFGTAMEAALTEVVKETGGKVLGSVRHPVGTTDFSSFVLQAQASGAQMVALLNAGDDTTNSIKQASDFGLVQGGQSLVGTVFYVTNVHGLGLDVAQGLRVATPFIWNQDAESIAFTERWRKEAGTENAPTHLHAGVYSGTLHYLRAVAAAGTDDSLTVAEKMREMPVDDFYGKGSPIRADGRVMRDMYFAEVKKPEESTGPWDYYKILATMPAADVIRPVEKGNCGYLKKG